MIEIGQSPQQQTSAAFTINEVDVWGKEHPELTSDLLGEYLAGDKLVTPIFDAMEGYSKVHTFKKRNLVFSSFALDAFKLSRFYFPTNPLPTNGTVE